MVVRAESASKIVGSAFSAKSKPAIARETMLVLKYRIATLTVGPTQCIVPPQGVTIGAFTRHWLYRLTGIADKIVAVLAFETGRLLPFTMSVDTLHRGVFSNP